MPDPIQNEGLTALSLHDHPHSEVRIAQVPSTVADDRSADELEAHSIKWNVARIVRLSSGRFALLTHYRAGALDLIKVGTIEEIASYIPTAEQCIPDQISRERMGGIKQAKLKLDLADLGL